MLQCGAAILPPCSCALAVSAVDTTAAASGCCTSQLQPFDALHVAREGAARSEGCAIAVHSLCCVAHAPTGYVVLHTRPQATSFRTRSCRQQAAEKQLVPPSASAACITTASINERSLMAVTRPHLLHHTMACSVCHVHRPSAQRIVAVSHIDMNGVYLSPFSGERKKKPPPLFAEHSVTETLAQDMPGSLNDMEQK